MATPRFDWITFDCYGTLIDWERGISGAFTAQAGRKGRTVDRSSVLDVYHAIEPVIEAESYRRYREVLGIAAEQVVERLGWTVPPEGTGFLAESLPSWPPFSDTNPALVRLAAGGVKLGILSNVDDDLLAWTRRHLAAFFEIVVTAQEVGSYKPAPAHFTAARSLIGDARWLHAAQSYYHDVAPCRALGIPVAWINRKGEAAADGGSPDHEFRTLGALADWLAPSSP